MGGRLELTIDRNGVNNTTRESHRRAQNRQTKQKAPRPSLGLFQFDISRENGVRPHNIVLENFA